MIHIAPSTLHAIMLCIYNDTNKDYSKLDIRSVFETNNILPPNYNIIYALLKLGYLLRKAIPNRVDRYLYKWNTDEPTLAMVDRVFTTTSIVHSEYKEAKSLGMGHNYLDELTLGSKKDISVTYTPVPRKKRVYTKNVIPANDTILIGESRLFSFMLMHGTKVEIFTTEADGVCIQIDDNKVYLYQKDLADFATVPLIKIAGKLIK